MLESLLERHRATDWDFRTIACPTDPRSSQFPRWVDDYRWKAAVAASLRPETTWEIGVRDAYSYAAFKQGHPATKYVGSGFTEGDTPETRGAALRWARHLADGTDDEFLTDEDEATPHPTDAIYDLVLVPSQPASAKGQRALELAVARGRHVLVDGYFQTREDCLRVSDFLHHYRDAIDHATILPGQAGMVLIKVKAAFLENERRRRGGQTEGGSEGLRDQYTNDYYLRDCGGWETFEQHGARKLDNARLQSLFDLAMLTRPKRLLDLGCGRGEIAYQAARQGVEVTAVDYSPAAIGIAKSCFEGEPELQKNVEWICGSAVDLALQGEYDVVVAGDLVEHLSPDELDRMYANIRRHLAPAGRLIVHTFPNLWFYRYHHARQRRTAAQIGAYLPADPRSRYEKLMHINEQSPRVLRRQLQRQFAHVLLWFLDPDAPAGSLAQPMTRRELASCRDLYAVASPVPIDEASLRGELAMQPLSPEQARGVTWSVGHCPTEAAAQTTFPVSITVQNRSGTALHSRPPAPVNLAYHWYTAPDRGAAVFDGQRSVFFPALATGESAEYEAIVRTPERAGKFLLCLTLVQEGVRWFDEVKPAELPTHPVEILPRAEAAP